MWWSWYLICVYLFLGIRLFKLQDWRISTYEMTTKFIITYVHDLSHRYLEKWITLTNPYEYQRVYVWSTNIKSNINFDLNNAISGAMKADILSYDVRVIRWGNAMSWKSYTWLLVCYVMRPSLATSCFPLNSI